jgi:hypothetical protein
VKHQYFGDINDYVKYGLLRALVRDDLVAHVAWMLTQADGRPDGRHIDYLRQPDRYRSYDSRLFDALTTAVDGARRDVGVAAETQLIPRATYTDRLLGDGITERRCYFDAVDAAAEGSDLVFFDPDNGLEVRSVRRGGRASSKYLYWDEVSSSFSDGRSAVIYQHFPRRERTSYLDELLALAESQLGSPALAVRTPRVAFLVVPIDTHRELITRRVADFVAAWAPLVGTHA